MGFDVEVAGRGSSALHHLLGDVLDERSIHPANGSLIISVIDQSALVAVIARLNDLGLAIERVIRVHDESS